MATLAQLVESEKKKSAFRIAKKLQSYARRYHRYKHRTHELKKSTTAVISPAFDVSLQATIYYAEFIIKGHHGGAWAPDPFLDNAMRRNATFIRNQYKTVVARAVNAYNRQNGK
jgi:hypothetical protein